MKRDILIFPKFNNIELIQNIREKYDRLYMLVPPHITLVFPFTDDISNEDLYIKLKELIKDTKKFNVKFKGLSLSDDNFIFLNCPSGVIYSYLFCHTLPFSVVSIILSI